jgi:hypothetical protein
MVAVSDCSSATNVVTRSTEVQPRHECQQDHTRSTKVVPKVIATFVDDCTTFVALSKLRVNVAQRCNCDEEVFPLVKQFGTNSKSIII